MSLGDSTVMLKNTVGQKFENKRGFASPVVPRSAFFVVDVPEKVADRLTTRHSVITAGLDLASRCPIVAGGKGKQQHCYPSKIHC